ncbi:MAG: hypothetical protein ACRDTC_19495 [Pseudonocardiaceae bacterium]
MAQPVWENGDRVPATPQRVPSDPTMLKALLRERHWQNYTMFTRAYQNAAKSLDKDLTETYPSLSTFRRWLAGQVQDLPHAQHCAVLETMLPGWTAAELFQPPYLPKDITGSTLLRDLLQHRCLHHYQQFCRTYDLTATTIDPNLVGSHPTEPQFHQWIRGQTPVLPHPAHCTVLEAMFPGYSARQLFPSTDPPLVEIAAPPMIEIAEPPEPASPDEPDPAVRDGRPESSGTPRLILPDEMPAWATVTGLPLPAPVAAALLQCLESLASSLATPQQRDRAYHQLEQLLRRWAHTMDRRNALQLLAWAATAAAAGTLDGDEYERVASVLSGRGRVDAQTIEHIEAVLWRCRRQDHALGPHAALDTVLAQRQLARSLLPHCPAPLRPQLLSVLSESSRLAGWLSFDLNQFDSAGYYYEDARSLAHEAQNAERGAFVLCEMSHLATSRGMPRTGIDHAVAAGQWANRTDDARLRAYAFDVAGRAYAADGQRGACLSALDASHAALPAAGDRTENSVLFYDEATHIGSRGLCHLELHDPQRAADYAQQSLGNLDPSFARDTAFITVGLSMAYVQCEEIDETARLLGDAAEIAAGNSSARLTERLRQARAQLQPWQDTNAVHQLDDRLATYALA